MRVHTNLLCFDCPVSLASLAVKQYWHERMHRDPGHSWLRATVAIMFHQPENREKEQPLTNPRALVSFCPVIFRVLHRTVKSQPITDRWCDSVWSAAPEPKDSWTSRATPRR